MINRLVLFSSLLCALLSMSGGFSTAWAQVSANLDALPDATPHATTHQAPSKRSRNAVSHPRNAVTHSRNNVPAHTSTKPPPAPTPAGYSRSLNIPAKAPTPTVITPPAFPVTLHPPVPAATVTPVTTSHSHVEPLPNNGLRILFDANSTDLNTATIEAVQHYAQSMAPKLNVRFILHSYASVPGSDISMPRRLALSRALSIRGLLVQNGVATTRIYPIAHGRPDTTDTAPTERLDILPESNPPPAPDTHLPVNRPSTEKAPAP